MDETESLRDQLFIRNWDAEQDLKAAYRYRSALKIDPAAKWLERGGHYDPLRPDEWQEAVKGLLQSIGIMDGPTSRQMIDDYNDFELLRSHVTILGTGSSIKEFNKFYVHGRYHRFEILHRDDGNLEVISAQAYDGSF